MDFLKRQVPELISRESKLSPWAYTLQTRFTNSCFMRGQIRRAKGLLTLKFTALMKGACLPTDRKLKAIDFALSNDRKGGTLVTYLPQGTTHLYQSMPVPLIAPTGSTVSLQTIFSQSFGTSTPGFYSVIDKDECATTITLLSPEPQTNTPADYKYWVNVVPRHKWRGLSFTPAWIVNGTCRYFRMSRYTVTMQ